MPEINLRLQVHKNNKCSYVTLPKWFCDIHKLKDEKIVFLNIVIHKIEIIKDKASQTKELAHLYYTG
jgi:hypothetical protein